MAREVFIQRSRFGRSIFSLQGEVLEVSSLFLGNESSRQIPIRTISSDYEIGAPRAWGLMLVPLAFATVSFGGVPLILNQRVFPHDLAIYPVMIGAWFLWMAYKGIPRVEYFTFKDHRHRPLFSLIREREQIERCNEFVVELLDRIERSRKNLPLDTVSGPARRVGSTSTLTLPQETMEENRWKFSVLAGAVATIFPVAAHPFPELAILSIPVVVVGSGLGLVAGGASFVTKEPKKHLALSGHLPFVSPRAVLLKYDKSSKKPERTSVADLIFFAFPSPHP